MAILKQKCPSCGTSVDRNARFCPKCGAALDKGKVKCGVCGREISASASFCPYCGREAASVQSPEFADNRWQRRDDDLATHIAIDDVRGFFAREFVVEPGTQAIILADGTNLGVVGPGKYTMDTLIERAEVFLQLRTAHRVEAVLVDAADADLQFQVARLFTGDPLPVDLTCRVVTRVGNPVRFLQTLLKSQRRYGLAELRDYLYVEVEDAAQEWLAAHSVNELAVNLKLRDELEIALGAHLRRTMERTGLELVQVRALDLAHEYIDRVTGERARAFLQISEEEAKLQDRKRLFDVLNEQEVQAFAEETAKVENYERRAAVWDRMRRAVLSDRMAELRTEEELEALLREQDRQKLIRDKEYEDLKRSFRDEQEDHELQRRFVQRKIEVEWQKELDRIALVGETELLELRLKRREMEWQAQLNEERMLAIERKKTEIDVRQQELEMALQEAKTQAEISRIQREQDKLDGELGVYMLELMDARKIKKQREEMLLEAEQEEKALERRLKEQADLHRQEMERLRFLADASVELLISVSSAEQAQMLADLKRSETLAGMSEEQILALAAEKSPEVARAFGEKFRAFSAEQQVEMYERMLKDRDAAKDQLTEALKEAAKMQQETSFRAMEAQRDIVVAYAQSGGQQAVIVTPGMGVGGMVAPAGTTGRAVVCPRCHLESPVGVKYCQNCGYEFFGAEQ
jgi:hypothetical protein